ncbi:MAG: 30S ribosomal protein S17e [Candidatus Helarchaeota archaeon]
MCGKVRTETIKRLAHDLYNRFSDQFNTDFDHNKQVLSQIATTSSKHFRNRIAGYITRLAVIEHKKELIEKNRNLNL